MARRKRKPADLPPFPWETEGRAFPRKTARLARPALVAASIEEVDGIVDTPRGTEVQTRKVPVWRRRASDLFLDLPEDCQAALAHYAHCVEFCGASSGGVDPTSTGGRTGAPTGPILARLDAARTVSDVAQTLDRLSASVCPSGPRLPYRRLVDLVAIDGATRTEIARRLDPTAARPSRRAMTAAETATGAAAHIVAVFLGYRAPSG
ncbi:hypothetical protein U879_05695 [Defluviimonas sp. 20V17]|uniref:Uncharacterized protein n=1 Tax=Allgaiera indica TaxID=765699 RepID=A0AAN5A0M0_9RHOB|nr:hypothetical protein [Allgaiera indica]KDB04634.1 hypothetical protein U879_05695 [Defluviimonas sp. 20V17]GHE03748.1 hypothetical protein GCM10008024_28340 [Allgaiera indica]SDX73529.1 hypothetical protein SAMN05444006_1273 [Allgaiera indica]